jgi:hypothetical protein
MFTLVEDERGYSVQTIELIQQSGGNLRTVAIDPNSF